MFYTFRLKYTVDDLNTDFKLLSISIYSPIYVYYSTICSEYIGDIDIVMTRDICAVDLLHL